jgi:hypothetical protein
MQLLKSSFSHLEMCLDVGERDSIGRVTFILPTVALHVHHCPSCDVSLCRARDAKFCLQRT